MGILGKFIHRRSTPTATPSEPYDTLSDDDTLPAVSEAKPMKERLAAGGGAALDKATHVYKRSPKLIGGLALVAGAFLLTRVRRGRPAIH